jgi:hypothetical protein
MMKTILIATALVAVLALPTVQAMADERLNLAPCNWAFQEEEPDAEQVRRCIVALVAEVQINRGERARLRQRIERLELLDEATGKDVDNLRAWSHCHGAQAECAALRP